MGYSLNRFKTRPFDDLICPICSGVCKDPVQCPDEHLFCRTCIKASYEDRSMFNCPIDQKTMTATDLSPVSRIIRQLIDKLEVRCNNDGCQEYITIELEDEHERSCPFSVKLESSAEEENAIHLMLIKDIKSLEVKNKQMDEEIKQLRTSLDSNTNRVDQFVCDFVNLRHEVQGILESFEKSFDDKIEAILLKRDRELNERIQKLESAEAKNRKDIDYLLQFNNKLHGSKTEEKVSNLQAGAGGSTGNNVGGSAGNNAIDDWSDNNVDEQISDDERSSYNPYANAAKDKNLQKVFYRTGSNSNANVKVDGYAKQKSKTIRANNFPGRDSTGERKSTVEFNVSTEVPTAPELHWGRIPFTVSENHEDLVKEFIREGMVTNDIIKEILMSLDFADYFPANSFKNIGRRVNHQLTNILKLWDICPSPETILFVGGNAYIAVVLAALFGPKCKIYTIRFGEGLLRSAGFGHFLDQGRLVYTADGNVLGRFGWQRGAPYDLIVSFNESQLQNARLHSQLTVDGIMFSIDKGKTVDFKSYEAVF